MATFNPLTQSPIEDSTQRSRGYTPDVSIATAIEDKSKLLTAEVGAVDEMIKTNINEQTRAGVESIRDSATGYLERGEYLGGANSIPGEVKTGIDKMAAMTEAKASGRLNESHYWNLLDAKARELRARHPGYKDYVDQRISSLAGANPANRLLQELYQESKSSKDTASKEYDYMFKKAVELGVIPDYAERAAAGKPYNYSELTSKVTKRTADIGTISLIKSQLEAKKANGEATTTDYLKGANKEMNLFVQNFITDATGPYSQLQKVMETAQTNASANSGNYSEKDLSAINLAFNKANAAIDSHYGTVMTRVDKNGDSYNSMLTKKEERDSILTTAKTALDVFKNAVYAKDGGMMGALALSNELQASQDTRTILSNPEYGEFFRQAQVANKTIGPYWTQLNAFQNAGVLSKAAKGLFNEGQLRTIQGKTNGDSALQIFKDLKAVKADSSVFRENINTNFERLGRKDLPANVFEEMATTYFGRDNLGFLTATDNRTGKEILNFDDKYGLFQKMLAPNVVANFTKYKDDKPELYNNFKGWVEYNTSALMRTAANQANSMSLTSENYALTWDPTTMNFMAKPTEAMMRKTGGNPADIVEGTFTDRPAIQAVADINKVINGYKSLLLAEKQDPNVKLPELIQGLGLAPDAQKQSSTARTVWNTMYDALAGATQQYSDKTPKSESPGNEVPKSQPESTLTPEDMLAKTKKYQEEGTELQTRDGTPFKWDPQTRKWRQWFQDGNTFGLEIGSDGNVVQPNKENQDRDMNAYSERKRKSPK